MNAAQERNKNTAVLAAVKYLEKLADRDQLVEGSRAEISFRPLKATVGKAEVSIPISAGALILGASQEVPKASNVDAKLLVACCWVS